MSPKAAKTVDKKEGMAEDKPQQEKKSGPPLKKAKKEQDEKPDAKDTQSIGEEKELDKMYQDMKYKDKKGNKHPLQAYNKFTSKKDKA